jgi:O-acetyl-ADP-ribose deacetylase (regulator of RNase III)
MIEIITGDLLEAPDKYIAHQCNCLTQGSAGVAKSIFDKFPHANTYARRVRLPSGETSNIDKPGTIAILGDGQSQRLVVNMYAQYYPGRPKFPNSNLDGSGARQNYFYRCLLLLAQVPSLESVGFPWRIGCNLGGGNWEYYLGVLTNFAQYVGDKGVKVRVYRREGDE